MADTKPIPVRLDDELISRLDTARSRMGTNRAALIRYLTKSFLDFFEKSGGVASLPPDWREVMHGQDGRKYGQVTRAKAVRKPAAKAKRAHLRDIDTVSMAIFNEMGAGAPLMPTDTPIGAAKVRRGRFPEDAFAARARGTSMTGVGVRDGDLVVLRWTEHQEARAGDIVCVHLFGEGSVLKQLRERGGHRWLISRNPAHPDICLDCEGEPKGKIQAVMIGKL